MRTIREIGMEINRDWQPPNYAAAPYLRAMIEEEYEDINTPADYSICRAAARSVVARFLGNAGTWRGETARRVKAELKGMLK
jgi:hypothetical protein